MVFKLNRPTKWNKKKKWINVWNNKKSSYFLKILLALQIKTTMARTWTQITQFQKEGEGEYQLENTYCCRKEIKTTNEMTDGTGLRMWTTCDDDCVCTFSYDCFIVFFLAYDDDKMRECARLAIASTRGETDTCTQEKKGKMARVAAPLTFVYTHTHASARLP